MVPRAVFRQVQGERRRRAALKDDPARLRTGSPLALSGRLICGLCGRTLKRYRQPGETDGEWRCRDRAYTRRTVSRETHSPCGCRNVRESEVRRAVLTVLNGLPARRDDLIRAQERLRGGELRRIDALTEEAEARRERLEARLERLDPEEGKDERAFLLGELGRIEADRAALLRERADFAVGELRLRLLLELADQLKEARDRAVDRLLGGGDCFPPPEVREDPVCRDAEEFFRRTRSPLPEGSVNGRGELICLDDALAVRCLESVTVLEEGCLVRLKGGPEELVRTEDPPPASPLFSGDSRSTG